MPNPSLTTTEFTALRTRVTTHDGPGVVVWCLEHGGFAEAADPYALRWISPDGTVDIVVGPEQGYDRQVLDLAEAILAALRGGPALPRAASLGRWVPRHTAQASAQWQPVGHAGWVHRRDGHGPRGRASAGRKPPGA